MFLLATRKFVFQFVGPRQANGKKLKPFIVFGNAKREPEALNDEFGQKCAIKFIPNAWMR